VPTTVREAGLRVVIYTDDHPPPHVHVFGDGECKIALGENGEAAALVRVIGAGLPESRRALRIVRERHAYLIECWNRIHE
jgi:hypothetical protein